MNAKFEYYDGLGLMFMEISWKFVVSSLYTVFCSSTNVLFYEHTIVQKFQISILLNLNIVSLSMGLMIDVVTLEIFFNVFCTSIHVLFSSMGIKMYMNVQ